MKSILFVQPNFKQGPKGVAAYLPYSSGIIWAYAQTSQIVKENFQLLDFIFERDWIDNVLDKYKSVDIVCFSTYVWNKNYNYLLAEKIKKINPNVITVFGGPELPITNKNIFKKFPFIDFVVKSEGEITFRNLLESIISESNTEDITGLLINQNKTVIDTGSTERINNLDIIPSPYLTGIFDSLIEKNPSIEWNATIETNRGCPYACTFCDWGSLTYSKIKKFELTRVFHELEWCGQHKIGYVDITDANFGIFPERDNLIVDKLIEVQQKYHFPYRSGWSWAKNQKQEVINIAKKLQNYAYNNGLTLSVQSMDEDVLTSIKRKNMEINKISDILQECQKINLPITTELILGLPNETLDTWTSGLYQLLEVGQHSNIESFSAQVLENAEMNLLQRKIYQIESTSVTDMLANSHLYNDIEETVNIVKSTSTMTIDDIADGFMKFLFLQTWHIGGISQIWARFLNKHNNISYKEFYEGLFRYIDGRFNFWNDEYNKTRSIYRNWLEKGNRISEKYKGVEITAFLLNFRLLMLLHGEQNHNDFYNILDQYINKNYRQLLSDELYTDVKSINDNFVVRFSKIKNYPTSIFVNHNVLEYINGTETLNNKEIVYSCVYPEEVNDDMNWFLENLFYRRRRNFGKLVLRK